MIPGQILVRPIISEKTMTEAAKSRYTFGVDKTCNKKEIREAIEKQFNVNVKNIKTITIKGKKKAIVELLPQQKIDLFEVTS